MSAVPAKRSLLRRLVALSQWPTKWAATAVLVDTLLTVLNQATFGLPTAWKTTLTLLLGAFGYLGIGPVLGPRFRVVFHISARTASVIGIVLLGLMIVVQQEASLPYSAIILGVIQAAGALGFAPAYVPTA